MSMTNELVPRHEYNTLRMPVNDKKSFKSTYGQVFNKTYF